MSATSNQPVVAIIGGGFTGAALAIHIARGRATGVFPRIVVFEPREKLGAGLAYSTSEPAHRINVPAGRMTLYPDFPESFVRFAEDSGILADDPGAYAKNGLPYPRRSAFGAYVAAEIQPYLNSGAIQHQRAVVTSIRRHEDRWLVLTDDGTALGVDIIAIATSHPAPALPDIFARVADHPKLIADATPNDALETIEKGDRILIVGNGLTSADVVAALDAKGHEGTILSISRRGLRSRGHAAVDQDAYGDFVTNPSSRASNLLSRIRTAVREANREGLTWHAVLDAVRSQGQDIWRALPVPERTRIARLARTYWDVHRFRVAPQVESVLDTAIAAGRLSICAASLRRIDADESGFTVVLRKRGTREPVSMHFDAVVITTGPAHGGVLSSQPFLAELQNAGLLTACATGLGISCDLNAMACDRQGVAVPGLFIAGPLARGTFGELMGLPQVTEHAVFVADQISAQLDLRASSQVTCRAG